MKPAPLLPVGARIAVVAPSGIFQPDRLAAGMALVSSWGYRLVEAPNLHATHRYTAGTVEQRLADLRWAFADPDIDAVWLARGGYGAVQLLSALPQLVHDDRLMIGFSDATALFSALYLAGAGRALHAPVLHSLADLVDDDSRAWLRQALAHGLDGLLPGHHLVGPATTVEGPLLGGNLCVLASLCGTPWALRGSGGIVLLEDIAEPPYKLDRMIQQLRLSGCFDGAVGVALGTFTGSRPPPDADWTIDQLLADLLAPLNLPVVAGLPVGHGPCNRAWLHGGRARLDPQRGLHVG